MPTICEQKIGISTLSYMDSEIKEGTLSQKFFESGGYTYDSLKWVATYSNLLSSMKYVVGDLKGSIGTSRKKEALRTKRKGISYEKYRWYSYYLYTFKKIGGIDTIDTSYNSIATTYAKYRSDL